MRGLLGRWAYLIVGGAMLTPYVLLGLVVASAFPVDPLGPDGLPVQLLIVAVSVPVVMATAFVPGVRVVEGAAARVLVGGPIAGFVVGEARSWVDRWRVAVYFVVHLLLGGVVSALTLTVPPGALLLFAVPFTRGSVRPGSVVWGFPRDRWDSWPAVLVGFAMVVVLVGVAAGAGWVLARLAPVLLGPSAADRLAALEVRAGRLVERNRLARELHDSVGHALSIVTIQAGAAGRVLDGDPEFARRALAAIEDAARGAVAELDHVLGLLREDEPSPVPRPTLAGLSALVGLSREAGVVVEVEVSGDVGRVPAVVSREAYRIVQEGLTNALRHAGRVPVSLVVVVGVDRLEVSVSNPLGSASEGRGRGGRGLRGVAERVAALRGEVSAAAEGGCWRLVVRLPWGVGG